MVIIAIAMMVAAMVSAMLVGCKKEQEIAELHNLAEQEDSFYQKLQDGLDVSILVVGDSIGGQAGASDSEHGWINLLAQDLQSTYGVTINVTNVSMGGNTSYAGYVRVMESGLSEDVSTDYDLAIICYGQNDSTENFSLYYESIIRAIRSKYSKCSIISILESSQKDYTEKMVIIKDICDYYNIPIVDTILPFTIDEDTYDNLTSDGIHPNDEGQQIYYETVRDVIGQHIGEEFVTAEVEPVNSGVIDFDNFFRIGINYSVSNSKKISYVGFTRKDEFTYVANCNDLGLESVNGILGIDYEYQSGENKAYVYIDDKEFVTLVVTFAYDFSQRHILIVSNKCTVNNEIKVIFETKEQADGFRGMIFSNSIEF